jgi:hypothetical protein
MKSLEEILENITRVVSTYESGQYKDLNEMQRILSTNMFFLAQKQVEYHQKFNAEYHLHKSTVNAQKQKYAEQVVPELYMCRKIMDASKNVAISMHLELKMN